MKSWVVLSFALLALLACSGACFAQNQPEASSKVCPGFAMKIRHAAAKVTEADTAEEAYDIYYVKLDLNVPNTGANLSGLATTKATVAASGMSDYVFELRPEMIVDSVRINGVLLPFTSGLNLRRVALPVPLAPGSRFTAEVGYHGNAVAPLSGLRSNRFRYTTSSSPDSDRVTYTLSESLEARDWWPCKQSLTDKIDSSDVWLTVPADCRGGSNGLLKAVTTLPGGAQRYEWQSRYPIDYYLISLTVSPFTEYSYYTRFSQADSMPVQNYVFRSLPFTPELKATIDSTGPFIQYFSGLFGRYPFWKEKYGHCMAWLGGGMEHQTMTSLGYFEGFLMAHELAHQWWGDDVTCGSWRDIWLNEGFATYSEYLYAAHFRSQAAADSRMAGWHNDIMYAPGGSVYVYDDTTDEARLFSGRLTYNKGAAVLHSLRFEAGSDSLFFALLQRYRQLHHFGTALSSDLRDLATQVYGRNMDTFFRQWIYGEGYPTIGAEWNQAGDTVYLRLRQSASMPTSVPLFSTPLEVRLASPSGDTTLRLQLSAAQQDYRFVSSRPVSGLAIDPANWIINREGAITRNSSLGQEGSGGAIVVAPNPSRGAWLLSGLPEDATMLLFDLNGKLLSRQSLAGQSSFRLDGSSLPAGIYLLKIRSEKGEPFATKLIRE